MVLLLDTDKKLMIMCKRHDIEYDAMIEHCPECKKEFDSGERIMRRFLCQLCGELKGTTKMYCGGPVGYMCDDCKRVVDKYMEMRERHLERWDKIKAERES